MSEFNINEAKQTVRMGKAAYEALRAIEKEPSGNEQLLFEVCFQLDKALNVIAAAPDLLDACKAWMKVESEMADNNPCPDLTLRAIYRKDAIRRTKSALAKTKIS